MTFLVIPPGGERALYGSAVCAVRMGGGVGEDEEREEEEGREDGKNHGEALKGWGLGWEEGRGPRGS